MTNIDNHTHTNKQTNTQGENIITSLSRVIISRVIITGGLELLTGVLHIITGGHQLLYDGH